MVCSWKALDGTQQLIYLTTANPSNFIPKCQ